MWQDIIKAKIENQAAVLKLQGCSTDVYEHLQKFKKEVTVGDKTNREGLSAKMFFRALYGSEFVRMRDDTINAALNYGYAIIRSAVAKTLSAYGYNCILGIHHISESNPFNLADDLMEPLRPIVDLWVDRNHQDLVKELTPVHKRSLIDIVNTTVKLNNRNMKLRYAIDRYVSSFTSAIQNQDVYLINIPMISRHTLQRGEPGDD
jgi:CRISPR-associated protein Cas1